MKLQIDTDKNVVNAVAEKTQTVDAVASATRIFLGTAISMGFVASAMGFFLLPGLQTTTTVSRNLPLQVMDVVRAVSVREPLETASFGEQRYYAGNTLVYEQLTPYSPEDTRSRNANQNSPLSISTNQLGTNSNTGAWAPLFGIPTAHAQATMFSIEPLPSGFPGQYIVLWYRQVGDTQNRIMTLCLGQTSAVNVYVGSDGSTYTDSRLRNRTTTRSCAALKSLGSGVKQVSQGAISIQSVDGQPQNAGEYALVKSGRILGEFVNGTWETNTPPEGDVIDPSILSGVDIPLWASFNPSDPAANLVMPKAVMRLRDGLTIPGQTTAQTLCFPGGTFDIIASGPVFHFDRNGNAYSDMFLTNRVMTTDCAATVARMLQITELNDLNGLAGFSDSFNLGPFRLWQDQRWVYTIFADGTGPFENYAFDPIGPMSIVSAPDIRQEGMDVPQTLFRIGTKVRLNENDAGRDFEAFICTPEYTYNGLSDVGRRTFYFDTLGNPYTDILLTNRAMTTDCADSYGRGLHVTMLTNATVASGNPGDFSATLNFQFGRATTFGQLVFPPGQYSMLTTTADAVTPFQLLLVASQTPTNQVTVPYLNLALTGGFTPDSDIPVTPLNATICLPSFTMSTADGQNFRRMFYARDGQPYSDLLLLDPINCTDPNGGGGGGIDPIETQ